MVYCHHLSSNLFQITNTHTQSAAKTTPEEVAHLD